MATLEELQRKPARTPVWVEQRLSGAKWAQGILLVALDGIRGSKPVAIIEFQDGVEHFLPEQVSMKDPAPAQNSLFSLT